MKRLLAALKTDITLQARNQLYGISIFISVLTAGMLAWLAPPDRLGGAVPMTLLLFAGGSTILYVVGMMILEKDDGTLNALSVSPLRPWEYLTSKVSSLTGIAVLEGLIMTLGALGLMDAPQWPQPVLFLAGLLGLGALHVLVGIILVVRYDRIMDAILPMSLVAVALQLPAFHFIGAVSSPWPLLIPSAAPTMLIQGAFVPLEPWQWFYSAGLTALLLPALFVWANAAFKTHITQKAG